MKQDGVKTRTGNKDWKCSECKKENSSVSSNKSTVESTMITKEFLVQVLENLKTEVFGELKSYSTKLDKVESALDFLSNNVDKANKLLEEVKKDYVEIRKQNDGLILENKQLKTSMSDLKDKVRVLEQYSRRTNLEISGLPETRNENTFALLRDVGNAIGEEIHENEVMAAHRVPSFNKKRPGAVVVQFLYRPQRDQWLSSFRRKKTLTANEVNSAFPNERVYINEHLSPENKQFLAEVKKKCREMNIKYVWTREGKFYVKRNDNQRTHKINKLEELAHV